MFPPVSGREVDPPEPPALEPADDDLGAYAHAPVSRYSQRFRILAFGLVVGGFIAVLYSAAVALLRLLAGPEYGDPFLFDRWPQLRADGQRFFPMFVNELIRSAPLVMLL